MSKNYFEVIRPGINSTFQDLGRKNLYHIGIPFSGAMDKRNYLLANAIAGNKGNAAIIEFAYQGPILKFKGKKVNFTITGDVNFKITKKNKEVDGCCYQNYKLEEGDILDIISTNRSVYGYLAISGNFDIQLQWNSYSTNIKAQIGANDGKKLEKNQKIKILDTHSHESKKKLEYLNNKIENIRVIKGTNYNYFSEDSKKFFFSKEFTVSKLTDRMGMRLEGIKIENIRVIKGTNYNYFSEDSKKIFFNKEFIVTNLTDRMGMRLKGPKIENNVDTNIKSEGIIKGVIQVPPDGNPIVMLSDHGTIGGYPKIGVVISSDYDKLVQIPPGSKIKFKEIKLSDAEMLFKLYEMETANLISKIK